MEDSDDSWSVSKMGKSVKVAVWHVEMAETAREGEGEGEGAI